MYESSFCFMEIKDFDLVNSSSRIINIYVMVWEDLLISPEQKYDIDFYSRIYWCRKKHWDDCRPIVGISIIPTH